MVEVVEELVAPCDPQVLFGWVDDLGRYPLWLEIVPRAEASPQVPGAWVVDLRGRIGPIARSKRLHMVRTVHEAPREVVFERRELDGRNHSMWRLAARVHPTDDGSRLEMRLSYGGALWAPVLERLLRQEIAESRTRLLSLVADGRPD